MRKRYNNLRYAAVTEGVFRDGLFLHVSPLERRRLCIKKKWQPVPWDRKGHHLF